jgi:hypothetical protein
MCKLSNTFILCACAPGKKLKTNYWILLSKKKFTVDIIGEAFVDFRTFEKSYMQIHEELEQKLNYQYPFDKPLELKEEDILKIKIPTDIHPKGETFCYMYTNTKWETYISDPFTEHSYKKQNKGMVELK